MEARLKRKKAVVLSDGELADRFGVIKALLEGAEAEIKELKAEFDARKLDFAKGLVWKVFKSVSEQSRIDVAAIRAAQGADWCKSFEKAGTRVSYLVKPVEVSAEVS